MRLTSKRFKEAKNLVQDKLYSIEESIELLKKTATAKFVESSEVHFCLNLNPKYADQQLRATVVLPHGTGKNIRVVAIASADSGLSSTDIGVERIGAEDLIEQINQGYTDFDVLIAEPDMMPKIAKLGRVLGPKGLMPSPKAGTVTKDIKSAVQEFKRGKLEYRVDKTGIVHINFGKVNFTETQLQDNLLTVYKSILQNKPTGVKGKYLKRMYVCSSMGPSIEIDYSVL
jgi:large subunit ribosomal protein L1|uniref:ribosomal protein L1 n=1 Tax=Lietzensia polymorpha TaxID=2962110 RepID=UPI002182454A|nr:ribosomal protein L1 [Lietzensia polymorpha]UVI61194.1 ribosomal protein L1 [Lietzensia polymorpha]